MGAVVEAAASRQRLDVGEGALHAGIVPDAQGAQAGRVEHQRATGQRDQLPARRRVAAALIVGSGLAHELAFLAQQPVDDGRLADARGAEERDGPPRSEMGLEPLATEPGHGAGDLDGYADRDLRDALEDGLEVGPQVRLAEHDHGLGATRPGRAEVAFQAPHVEVARERLDDEDGVDIGGHDLGVDAALRRRSDERGAPRQHGLDGHGGVGTARWLDAPDDPVADRWSVGRDGGGVAEVAAQARRPGASRGHHDGATSRCTDDATGLGVTGPLGGHGRLEVVVPAPGREIDGDAWCPGHGRADGFHQPTRLSLPVRLA